MEYFEGPNVGFSKVKKGFIDFKICFETESLSAMVAHKDVGTVLLQYGRDLCYSLNNTADLVRANGLFIRNYCAERSWRTLDYLEATKADFPLMKQGVFIHPSAQVGEGCQIGPDCYIGRSVVLGKGVRVANAIVLGGCEIGDYCFIQDAIVGFNSSMDKWARVEGNREKGKVTVVGVGVRLEAEVHIFDCLVLPNKQVFLSYHNQTVV